MPRGPINPDTGVTDEDEFIDATRVLPNLDREELEALVRDDAGQGKPWLVELARDELAERDEQSGSVRGLFKHEDEVDGMAIGPLTVAGAGTHPFAPGPFGPKPQPAQGVTLRAR